MRQLSDRKVRSAPSGGLSAPSDREVRDSWQRLSRHLAQKKESLQGMLSTSKPGVSYLGQYKQAEGGGGGGGGGGNSQH